VPRSEEVHLQRARGETYLDVRHFRISIRNRPNSGSASAAKRSLAACVDKPLIEGSHVVEHKKDG
jgi:hypothetical protein